MGDCFAPLGPPLLPWPAGTRWHRTTHGHGDSMTESAQWGRFSEMQIREYQISPEVSLHTVPEWRRGRADRHTDRMIDIVTYSLRRPRGLLSEKVLIK